jgi:hypothetical protein
LLFILGAGYVHLAPATIALAQSKNAAPAITVYQDPG